MVANCDGGSDEGHVDVEPGAATVRRTSDNEEDGSAELVDGVKTEANHEGPEHALLEEGGLDEREGPNDPHEAIPGHVTSDHGTPCDIFPAIASKFNCIFAKSGLQSRQEVVIKAMEHHEGQHDESCGKDGALEIPIEIVLFDGVSHSGLFSSKEL